MIPVQSTNQLRRHRYAVLVLVNFLVAAPTLAIAAPPGWTQTWGDEFDGTSVDAAKWDRIYWNTPFNNEQQAYRPDRATVSGGNLVLTADDTPNGGKQYTSGKVESTYTQHYGRWEVRAKLPGTLGTWPAIWLLPDTDVYNWPTQGEIDILENRGNQPNLVSSAHHWGPNFNGRQFTFAEETYSGPASGNYHNDFHVYAVEWDASALKFFVDDVNYHTITNAQTANVHYPNGFLSQQTAPMETVLNVAVGGDFLGGAQPNGSSNWPQEMLIDYVRIFERDTTPTPFVNGSFEDAGGSLDGWTLFGNSIPNVSAQSEAVLDGSHSLKIFGQFNGGQNFSGAQQGISVEGGDSLSATASAYVRSADALENGNVVTMKFDYYSVFGGEFATSAYLSSSAPITIGDTATNHDMWLEHTLAATAPEGAVEARLVFLFDQPSNGGGAIHIDDVSFAALALEPNADANDDGSVDGSDFLDWQLGLGLTGTPSVADGDYNHDDTVDATDLAVWQQQYGTLIPASITAVPEPGTLVLCLALLSMGFRKTRLQ
ncbi:family 16 glycosylhydrolase [Adhaeretor mobilis]|uniref:Beta-glucanase n=1 Tax=Adhaeretor mobilis TaxID=1930276 RepID=A0A517MYE1_9BACT|nr:family 16 glycosylhydrolase [Adhaeretor mobilis]QDS99901.1 Beta-glucanase precursor [Adhaeretor mobilis]